jgi:hypothetical protein
MLNVSHPSDRRRGNILLVVAIAFALASFFLSRFSYELCHSGIPLTVTSIVVPGVGASCAFVALFFASSSTSITILKAIAVAVNLYMLAWAGILLTGLGVLNCG